MEAENVVEQDNEQGTGPVKDRAGVKVAVAAALLCAILAGLWGTGQFDSPSDQAETAKPVACEAPRPTDAQGYAAVCAALNRPDLPALLGTPTDHVVVAHPMPMAIGKEPMVEVRLQHVAVALMESTFSVDDRFEMRPGLTAQATVLGHPAATYSSSTIAFVPAKNGKADTKPGPDTRNILVAQDAKASGGRTFELVVSREDGTDIGDPTLNRLAETLLPTLPGWVAS
ncbi:DUF6215 domain-containing protein [Streptomyces sp. NRRL WC-3742]|uniref:DUF6215 domain-containing protein n=1 Tax=Streptomyces sp. NRRL WC-3742 TaxID=1463934 RepID=UPI00068EFF73|nr:DUF6215 domain-containing protein [Streptomyces sp. NRRL WC-3742]